MKSYDICVVGLGPVGLSFMSAASSYELTCCGVDANNFVGGQCTALYPQKIMKNVVGAYKVQSSDLVANMYEQASSAGTNSFILGKSVTAFKEGEILLDDHSTINARFVVLAIGKGIIAPKTLKNKYLNVFYDQPGNEIKNSKIAVLGAGDSAFDAALRLASQNNTVYIVHRSDRFKAQPKQITDARANSLIHFAQVLNFEKEIMAKDNKIIGFSEYTVDSVFCFYGMASDPSSKLLSIDPSNEKFAKLNENTYAVGDVVKTKPFNELFGNSHALAREIAEQAID